MELSRAIFGIALVIIIICILVYAYFQFRSDDCFRRIRRAQNIDIPNIVVNAWGSEQTQELQRYVREANARQEMGINRASVSKNAVSPQHRDTNVEPNCIIAGAKSMPELKRRKSVCLDSRTAIQEHKADAYARMYFSESSSTSSLVVDESSSMFISGLTSYQTSKYCSDSKKGKEEEEVDTEGEDDVQTSEHVGHTSSSTRVLESLYEQTVEGCSSSQDHHTA